MGLLLANWKYIALALLILGAVWFVKDLKNQIKEKEQEIIALNVDLNTSRENERKLEQAVLIANKSVELLEKQRDKDQIRMDQIANERTEARQEVRNLKNKFKRHDLGNLTLKKPGLIEKIINKGTKKVLDGLVDITDSSKEEEKKIEKPVLPPKPPTVEQEEIDNE